MSFSRIQRLVSHSSPPLPPSPSSPPPATPQNKTLKQLDESLGIIHGVGERLLGPLYMTLFESLQDAIALGLLIRIPSTLSKWTIGEEFSGLDQCWEGNTIYAIARYVCFAVVLSDYALWLVLIFRVFYRLLKDLRKIFRG